MHDTVAHHRHADVPKGKQMYYAWIVVPGRLDQVQLPPTKNKCGPNADLPTTTTSSITATTTTTTTTATTKSATKASTVAISTTKKRQRRDHSPSHKTEDDEDIEYFSDEETGIMVSTRSIRCGASCWSQFRTRGYFNASKGWRSACSNDTSLDHVKLGADQLMQQSVYTLVIFGFLVDEQGAVQPDKIPVFKGDIAFKNSYGYLPLNLHPLLVVRVVSMKAVSLTLTSSMVSWPLHTCLWALYGSHCWVCAMQISFVFSSCSVQSSE